jgi:ABC-type protease/lipase transport system fused ATPase/permease subunit
VHSGLIATAGWLLGIGQLTLGQFVAAEVVVSGILSSFDGVVKRMGHIYYFLTALTELSFLFSLPKDQDTATLSIPLPDPTVHGIRVTCKDLTFAPPADRPSSSASTWKSRPAKKSAFMRTAQWLKLRWPGYWAVWNRPPPA